jgi:hypothetical protein
MKKTFRGLCVAVLAICAAGAGASAASAVTVSVEVEGLQLSVPPTVVQTPATVTKGGDTCPDGANVIGALDVLTKGDWDGSTSGATRILSEDHPFVPDTAGWAFVINGKATADYGCGAALHDGDKLLWYASAGFGDFHAPVGYDDPVLLDAPTTAVPGVPFTVTATDTNTTYDENYTPTTTFVPAQGATVSGGTAAVTTGADGKAQVTVAPGPYTLVVTQKLQNDRAPARIVGCATTGSDGQCGTTQRVCLVSADASCGTLPGGPPAPCKTNGHDGFCGTTDTQAAYAKLGGVTEGKTYKKGSGPRELTGTVETDASGLKDIRLRLTRNTKGKCATYDAKSEKFKTMKKCGAAHGTWFSVGTKQAISYLLPSRLTTGRYVLDVETIDLKGNTSQLARGTSRVVFTVG